MKRISGEEEKAISSEVERAYKREHNYVGLDWAYTDEDRRKLRHRIENAKIEAQLEADQAVVREIIEGIERFADKDLFSAGLFQVVMTSKEWQALKKKVLG